jgi:hypothetical protein
MKDAALVGVEAAMSSCASDRTGASDKKATFDLCLWGPTSALQRAWCPNCSCIVWSRSVCYHCALGRVACHVGECAYKRSSGRASNSKRNQVAVHYGNATAYCNENCALHVRPDFKTINDKHKSTIVCLELKLRILANQCAFIF